MLEWGAERFFVTLFARMVFNYVIFKQFSLKYLLFTRRREIRRQTVLRVWIRNCVTRWLNFYLPSYRLSAQFPEMETNLTVSDSKSGNPGSRYAKLSNPCDWPSYDKVTTVSVSTWFHFFILYSQEWWWLKMWRYTANNFQQRTTSKSYVYNNTDDAEKQK